MSQFRTINNLAENIQSERAALTEQVWRYLLDNENKGALASYNGKKSGIDAAVTSLSEKITNKTTEKARKEEEIKKLEKGTTSIQPTIDEINAILQSFGFLDFTLAQSRRSGFTKFSDLMEKMRRKLSVKVRGASSLFCISTI